jgi:hypothetical protein
VAGTPWLDVYCPDCRTSRALDIRTIDRHPLASVEITRPEPRAAAAFPPTSAPRALPLQPMIMHRSEPPVVRCVLDRLRDHDVVQNQIHAKQRPMIRPKTGSANRLATGSQCDARIGFAAFIASSVSKAFCRAGVAFASSGEAAFFRTTVVLLVEAGAVASVPPKTRNRSLFRSRLTFVVAPPEDRTVSSACNRWSEN